MTDYSNWKILKSDLDKKQEEYSQVADWCNENQQYTIEDDGDYYKVALIPEPTIEEKQKYARDVRNNYLETYVDPLVTNPLRWADLSEEEQTQIKEYRLYLLNYTEEESWWEKLPKTFEEWLNA